VVSGFSSLTNEGIEGTVIVDENSALDCSANFPSAILPAYRSRDNLVDCETQ